MGFALSTPIGASFLTHWGLKATLRPPPPQLPGPPPLTCIDQSYADVTLKYLQDNKEPVQSNVDDVTTLNLLFGKRCVLRDNDSVQLYGLKGTRSIPTNHSKKNNEILV